MCKNVKCAAVHVDWFGGGGGRGDAHNFLKGRFFSMGIFELKCKFLRSETVFRIVIGRHGFLGWQDFAGRQDFAGGQDLSGVFGELYIL